MTKAEHYEQICDNTLIRVSKERGRIEIKKDLSRFEDAYYDFQSIDFDGFDISVQNFIPFAIPDTKLLFLLINPKITARIGHK